MIDALEIGDDCLVLSQRLAAQVTRAPTLEEDIALANLSLDLLGQARALLSRVGDEDELAYRRGPAEYRNCLLVEQPDADFAHTVVRHLLYSTFLHALYADHPDDDVAAKGIKELAYHRDYAGLWAVRLGRGTQESGRRMVAALAALWPYTGEIFAVRPETEERVGQVLRQAGLQAPHGVPQRDGGRRGEHTEHLTGLLDELQCLHREHLGARW
ncbi:1,2-phenylacetyl-CoA epoxidase subunit PaaC [Nonomuraea sp. NPDC050404]|uniref:1,2-phenylacetyl-CoA epoxidase subunit PaaC n=1 Tax=Nonomuraea sp. NPDC050404 TaxID=3155783 RepID=UPI0033C5B872